MTNELEDFVAAFESADSTCIALRPGFGSTGAGSIVA
jgi:hypothetical protein